MLNLRHWVMLTLALAFLLLAVSLDHPFFSNAEHGLTIINTYAVATLAKEIAFALIISVGISIGIEKQARDSDVRSAERMRREIAEDVFRGVFSANIPREYVDAVINSALKKTIVREFAQLEDTIGPLRGPDADFAGEDAREFLRQHRVSTYRLKNVTSEQLTHTVTINLPTRPGKLVALSRVTRVEIGARSLTDDEIAEVRVEDEQLERVIYAVKVDIAAGGSVDILVESIFLKEHSSADVIAMLDPCLRMDYTAHFEADVAEFGFSARSITPARKVYEDKDTRTLRWIIDGPMLPHDHLIVWWRNPVRR